MFINSKRTGRIGLNLSKSEVRTMPCILATNCGAGSYSRIYKFDKYNKQINTITNTVNNIVSKPVSNFYAIVLEGFLKTHPF
jgi:hypothetical protein